MHPASMENMQRCIDWYLPADARQVIDLGSYDVNGSYRSLLPDFVTYTGFDLEDGPGVDVVLEDAYSLPLDDGSVDVVMSGQMLEHCAHFWRVFEEVARVLKPGGLAFFNAPSAGPIHRYPVDCYRFYPDAYQALADWAGLRLVHCWRDPRGPWEDLMGVFQKGGDLAPVTGPTKTGADRVAPLHPPHADPSVEVTAGAAPYTDILAELHRQIDPDLYVEIGVRKGKSLALCRGDMIGVDPDPDLERGFDQLTLFECTSDDFFFFHADKAITKAIDLSFIDGMHLFEFALRDFMNLERRMAAGGAIVIDDVLPNHQVQAERDRQSQVWCGDVWRLVPFLRTHRPDLKLTLLDTAPTGLLIISNLDPDNKVLWQRYNPTVRKMLESPNEVPEPILTRAGARPPTEAQVRMALEN